MNKVVVMLFIATMMISCEKETPSIDVIMVKQFSFEASTVKGKPLSDRYWKASGRVEGYYRDSLVQRGTFAEWHAPGFVYRKESQIAREWSNEGAFTDTIWYQYYPEMLLYNDVEDSAKLESLMVFSSGVEYDTLRFEITDGGIREVADSTCYFIRIRDKISDAIYEQYFDTATYIERRRVMPFKKDAKIAFQFDDYEVKNGVFIPTRVCKEFLGQQLRYVYFRDTLVMDTLLAESVFLPPDSALRYRHDRDFLKESPYWK